MAKYKHLTLDERGAIQCGLNSGLSFKQIGVGLGKDPTTISKEVKNHFQVVEKGGYGRPFNPCVHRKDCAMTSLCDNSDCRAANCSLCRSGKRCYQFCPDFQEEKCPRLARPPYVCNGCPKRNHCTLRKRVYDARFAHGEYQYVLSDSRQGVFTSPDELAAIDELVTPLVKQGQSIHHICANNADIIMLDEKTVYNYVDAGLLSVKNIDLPRKVRYRTRKKQKRFKVDRACYEGRTYEDFLNFKEDNPDVPVVEMDSVEGKKGGKVLLTLFFRNTNLLLAFLRDSNTARSVTDIIDALYESLGSELYSLLFPVILTDRGSEFSNPKAIEYDQGGNLRSLVFYCDPSQPNQKGRIEVAHELVRRIVPKGTSFNQFTQDDINRMTDHINSYGRKKLNNRSAHQLFSLLYGEDVLDKLNVHAVTPNDIVLCPELLKE